VPAAVLAVALVAVPGQLTAQAGDGGGPPPPRRSFPAQVVRVVDGDTFVARRGGRELRVRLIGIDAPESVRPEAPVECFGPEAGAALTRMLPAGSTVRAAYQAGGHRDQYGRRLWDVWRPGGAFVQARLVRRGFAEARAYQPQTEHADVLDRVERRARAAGAGLWGAC
jgi:micrococcal nuclease